MPPNINEKTPCAVYPNPIDAEEFTHALSEGNALKSTVICPGRLEWHKGPHVLAKAIPLVVKADSSVTFSFVGNDWYWSGGGLLSHYIKSLIPLWAQDKVIFEKGILRSDMASRYRQSLISVIPSLWENFPNTVLESMACGVPVIASRVGGIPEQIEDRQSGYLVTPDDPQELAHAILTLAGDEALRKRLRAGALQKVHRDFSAQVIVPKALAFYDKVLGK